MRFSVDPWDPAFGASLEAELGESTAEVDATVERPVTRWDPVDPPRHVPHPAVVLFVDGVRRVDAQVWVDEPDGTVTPALCASIGAGVVGCRPGQSAELRAVEVRRALVTTSPAAGEIVTSAGSYPVVRVGSQPGVPLPRVLSEGVQAALHALEVEVATAARDGECTGEDALLVVDGGLRRQRHLPNTLGLVKTHRSTYLPQALGAVVTRLGPTQRTPVFRVGTSWWRYSWYLRLPVWARAPWAGVVRVEGGPDLTPEQAVALADLSQVVLPRYASAEHKDGRAPQNLYPVAGLERAVRRRLGDPALLYRALRHAAATPRS